MLTVFEGQARGTCEAELLAECAAECAWHAETLHAAQELEHKSRSERRTRSALSETPATP